MAFSPKFNPWTKTFQWISDTSSVAWSAITGIPAAISGTQEAFTTALKNKLDSVVNPMLFKGDIAVAADFPTIATVQNGWTYHVSSDVTDNDATKTNTGLSFLSDAEIAWNGSTWVSLGYSTVKSVAGRTGVVVLTSSDVGLGNVDNKSEATIITDVKADTDVADAISKKHTQGTDATLDDGGANEVSASELRTALDVTIPSKVDKMVLDSDTVFLSHFDGIDGAKVTTDISASGHIITFNGDAELDTASKKFGLSSILFQNSNSWLSIPSSDDWNFGNSDFTIELWIKPSLSGDQMILTVDPTSDVGSYGYAAFMLTLQSSGQILIHASSSGAAWDLATGGVFAYAGLFNSSVYAHLAIVRYAGGLHCYVNGVYAGALSVGTASFYHGTRGILFGRQAGGILFNGNMDEIRISKGVARYTTAFTPPTAPFGLAGLLPKIIDSGNLEASTVTEEDALDAISKKHTHTNSADLANVSGTNTGDQHYAQTVVVAQSGGDYTTISAALTAITDAATGKRYAVVVHPGVYTETVTMKAFVDIIGVDRHLCHITQSSADTVVAADDCKLINLEISNTHSTLGSACVELDHTTDTFEIHNCYIHKTTSGTGVIAVGDATGAATKPLKIYDSIVEATVTSASSDSAYALYRIGALTAYNCRFTTSGGDGGDTAVQLRAGIQTLVNCVIEALSSSDENTRCVYKDTSDTTYLINCSLNNNTSGGKEIYCESATVIIVGGGRISSLGNSGAGTITNVLEISSDATPELGGELNCGSHSIGFTEQAITSSSGTATIDWRNSNKAKITLSENVTTFTWTAPSNPCNLILKVIQGSGVAYSISWPAAVIWAGGSGPTLTATSGAIDIIACYYDGTYYYASATQNFVIS